MSHGLVAGGGGSTPRGDVALPGRGVVLLAENENENETSRGDRARLLARAADDEGRARERGVISDRRRVLR